MFHVPDRCVSGFKFVDQNVLQFSRPTKWLPAIGQRLSPDPSASAGWGNVGLFHKPPISKTSRLGHAQRGHLILGIIQVFQSHGRVWSRLNQRGIFRNLRWLGLII